MPVVRINDATFADLSTLKTWFGTKTPSETIDRLVRETMDQLGMERDDEPEAVVTTTSDGSFRSAMVSSALSSLSRNAAGTSLMETWRVCRRPSFGNEVSQKPPGLATCRNS